MIQTPSNDNDTSKNDQSEQASSDISADVTSDHVLDDKSSGTPTEASAAPDGQETNEAVEQPSESDEKQDESKLNQFPKTSSSNIGQTDALGSSEHHQAQFEQPKKDTTSPYTKDTQVLSRNNSLMRRALHSQQVGETSKEGKTTSTLGDTREIILLVRGMVERVVMREGVSYKLGRFDLGASAEDEIDLTPYGAMDRGVSRLHASLHLQDDQLYITDLNSTNGTYIAGARIDPDTPTTLRKGDELLLGRLAVQVLFR